MSEPHGPIPARSESGNQPAGNSAPDFMPLRARLGRMLGRPAPVSEAELHEANLALVAAIKAPDRLRHFEEHRLELPAALAPLLLTHLASAWAQADTAVGAALESIHLCLVQSVAKEAARSPASL
jgi:hypothetical protein